MKKFQLAVSGLAFATAVVFNACGDDSSTTKVIENQISERAQLVESADSLSECSEDVLGGIALVTSTNTIYVCDGDKWVPSVAKSDENEKIEFEKFEVSIVDDEESLGDCDKKHNGDLSMVTETGLLYVCNGKKWTAASIKQDPDSINNAIVDTTSNDPDVEVDPEKIPVSLDTVKGLSQKGPYLTGSEVVIYELKDGYSLKQTGKTYRGRIINDNGTFAVAANVFESQYAELVAKGSYRNEVSGDASDGELSLSAVTNLMKRTSVNVNILTHLEYFRVKYLTTKKDMRVQKAKAQAQKEIFAAFGIDANNFSNSEDLNIAGASNENAALIAVSILLQGDLSTKNLSERLTNMSTDIQSDGVWNDTVTIKSIADWAMQKDLNDSLKVFRANIKAWNLSAKVADFEPHIRNFWSGVYGLEKCTDENEDVIVADSVKGTAAYYLGKGDFAKARFLCKSGRWIFASDSLKDTYKWKKGKVGEFKQGNVTGLYYVFDKSGWTLASAIVQDTMSFKANPENGDEAYGDSLGTYYYNTTQGWHVATSAELMLQGCSEKKEGVLASTMKSECPGFSCKAGSYYVCKSGIWEHVEDIAADTIGWTAADDGTVRHGDSVSTNCYAYSAKDKEWVLERSDYPLLYVNTYDSIPNCTIGFMCNEQFRGLMKAYEQSTGTAYYQCKLTADNQYKWISVSKKIYDLGSCPKAASYGILEEFSKYIPMQCVDFEWNEIPAVLDTFSGLSEYKYTAVDTQNWEKGKIGDVRWGDSTWLCYEYGENGWNETSVYSCILEKNCSMDSHLGEYVKTNAGGHKYKYGVSNFDIEIKLNTYYFNTTETSDGWHELSWPESGDNYYLCNGNGTWHGLGYAENSIKELVAKGAVCDTIGKWVASPSSPTEHIVCDVNYEWREAYVEEERIGHSCTLALHGIDTIFVYGGKKYVCKIDHGSSSRAFFTEAGFFDNPVSVKDSFVDKSKVVGYLTDSRDGKEYPMAKVGSQIWMAENLNFDDSKIRESVSSCYEDDHSCDLAGRLYRWSGAMNLNDKWSWGMAREHAGLIENPHRGACPENSHIPSKSEAEELQNFVGRENGDKLVSEFFGKTNDFGFSALLSGIQLEYGNLLENTMLFWTTEEVSNGNDAVYVQIMDGEINVKDENAVTKSYRLSVRCILDSESAKNYRAVTE